VVVDCHVGVDQGVGELVAPSSEDGGTRIDGQLAHLARRGSIAPGGRCRSPASSNRSVPMLPDVRTPDKAIEPRIARLSGRVLAAVARQTSTHLSAMVATPEPRRQAMRKRAVVAVVGISGAAILLGVTSAEAAPKNGLTFEVTCPGSAPFTIVTPPGNGAFTPAFGPNQVFIPYDVAGITTVDGQVVDTFHDVKPAPVPAGAVSCTFGTSFEEDGSVIAITGTALVVPRP
jgi:hypothetical protein